MAPSESISLALSTVKELFPDGANHRLEEFSALDSGEVEITVSFRPPYSVGELFRLSSSPFSANRAALGIDQNRVYKDVRIGNDGKVKSVKMRQIVLG